MMVTISVHTTTEFTTNAAPPTVQNLAISMPYVFQIALIRLGSELMFTFLLCPGEDSSLGRMYFYLP